MQHLGYELAQQQKMKMSPQVMQNIGLLTLPLVDLALKIEESLDNPAIELVRNQETVSFERLEESQGTGEPDLFENSSDSGFMHNVKESSHFDSAASDVHRGIIEGVLSREETLQEHLLSQLRVQPLPEGDIQIGELIIENLDERGFFREPLEIALGDFDVGKVNSLLSLIRGLDPPGTAVTDFIESLKIQAEIRGDAPEFFNELMTEETLELLNRNRIKEVAKAYSILEDEVKELLTYLTLLNPFPGALFSNQTPDYVIPDLSIMREGDTLIVKVNQEDLPVVQLSSAFTEMAEDKGQSTDVKKFVRKHLYDANGLISVLEIRHSTLERLGSELVVFQHDFFVKGSKFIKPMRLIDMAEKIGVHESTVSRITTSKYIQTDWGIFPLKLFFSSAVKQEGKAEVLSKNSVKEHLREIIENHKGEKKLSDQKIADILKQKGFSMARRTVAKYRNELNIASSFDRGSL